MIASVIAPRRGTFRPRMVSGVRARSSAWRAVSAGAREAEARAPEASLAGSTGLSVDTRRAIYDGTSTPSRSRRPAGRGVRSILMNLFDPHIHMISRTTDDYERMALAGIRAVVEPAFWIGEPR